MHVHWLIPGHYSSLQQIEQSNLASIRMRAGLTLRHAHAMGVAFSAGDTITSDADLVIIGKIGTDCRNGRSEYWLAQLARFKEASGSIALDYTDHHLGIEGSKMKDFYRDALPLVDRAIVPSDHMGRLLTPHFGRSITVIEDPLEVPVIPVREVPANTPYTLLWFGHDTNISYLVRYLENHALCDANSRLIVLSNAVGLKMLSSKSLNLHCRLGVQMAEWSLETMLEAASLCQGCIIPSDTADPRKSGASSNRLITALALGLPTLAQALPSYIPFASFFENIEQVTLSSFLQRLAPLSAEVVRAQETVIPQFRQDVVAGKWGTFFKSCAGHHPH